MDQYMLSMDTNFSNRVQASMIAAAVSITNEGWTVAFHRERAIFANQVLASPNGTPNYKQLFTNYCGTDTNCISDATQAGTVTLTVGNTPAQAALVTDTHINNAISSCWNSFVREPAN